MDSTSRVLFQSLIEGPLLVGDLEEASTFAHGELCMPVSCAGLRIQQKLGHLYEDALAALLEASPRYRMLARNLQLQPNAQTTLGELDFLLRDQESGRIIHLELAAKFYLAIETPSGLQLPGPDPIDNYYRKIDRLRTHQLPLTRLHHSALPEEIQGKEIVTQQLIYGCLFDSIHATQRAQPPSIHPDCRRGRWLSIDEVGGFFGKVPDLRVIPKSLWPVRIDLLADELLSPWPRQEKLERCVMVRFGGQSEPYFIVPSHFPLPTPTS